MADELTLRMKEFDALPVVTPTWPWPKRIVDDPELCSEMSRVLRCGSTSLRSRPLGTLTKIVASEPPLIALHWSPFHDAFWNDLQWTPDEVCGPITDKDLRYVRFFLSKAREAKDIIGELPVLMIFDYEVDCVQNDFVKQRLTMMYHLAKFAFRAEVMFYNQHQWAPGYDTVLVPPRLQSPIPEGVPGDLANVSLYTPVSGKRVFDILTATREHSGEPMAAWVSVGGVYTLLPWAKEGRKRSLDVTHVPPLGETYLAGKWLYGELASRFDIKYVVLWPEPLKLGDEHFIEFLNGALGVKR